MLLFTFSFFTHSLSFFLYKYQRKIFNFIYKQLKNNINQAVQSFLS